MDLSCLNSFDRPSTVLAKVYQVDGLFFIENPVCKKPVKEKIRNISFSFPDSGIYDNRNFMSSEKLQSKKPVV